MLENIVDTELKIVRIITQKKKKKLFKKNAFPQIFRIVTSQKDEICLMFYSFILSALRLVTN